MKDWFIINGEKFMASDIGIQYTINENHVTHRNKVRSSIGRTSCDITIITDITNQNKFFNLFDNRERFDINCNNLIAEGCRIKTIDIHSNNNSLTLDIISDFVRVKDKSDQRDEIIDSILNETSNKKDNIK